MECKRIADQLRRSVHGEAWHGPALMELLGDVGWEKAAARPIAGAHSIWEITLHITAWADVCRRRAGGEAVELTDDEDWPAIGNVSETAWRRAVEDLERSEARLAEMVDRLADDRLAEAVAGKSYSLYFLLHGVVQHNIYHAGQIALLKKG